MCFFFLQKKSSYVFGLILQCKAMILVTTTRRIFSLFVYKCYNVSMATSLEGRVEALLWHPPKLKVCSSNVRNMIMVTNSRYNMPSCRSLVFGSIRGSITRSWLHLCSTVLQTRASGCLLSHHDKMLTTMVVYASTTNWYRSDSSTMASCNNTIIPRNLLHFRRESNAC